MAQISAQTVKELRERTSAGMMDCKKALEACGCDMDKAISWLREKGLSKAAKKSGRATSEGIIGSYVHAGGKIAVLVEIKCETDFVARSDKFQEFAKNVAMQIAAATPVCLKSEDLPAALLANEKEIYLAQTKAEGKPANIAEKIVEGRIKKFYKEVCLLEQPFIKDDKLSIQDLLNDLIATLGENIQISRFVRMQLGEDAGEEKE
jgi:elongation factor Ts